MKNGYKLKWSDRALNEVKSIFEFISITWSKKEVSEFARKLNKRVDLLTQYPELYPKTFEKENIRRSVLTKQITIYYSLEDDTIKIVSVFDVRQNPTKL